MRHVLEVQETVRTCADCGLCCTEAHNSVRIVASEARRIAAHLALLEPRRRAELMARVEGSIKKYRLTASRKTHYTCPFLEADMRCAIPLDVKPVACLAFNPLTQDACDQEPEWYAAAHEVEVTASRVGMEEPSLKPIPVALMDALHENDARDTPRPLR